MSDPYGFATRPEFLKSPFETCERCKRTGQKLMVSHHMSCVAWVCGDCERRMLDPKMPVDTWDPNPQHNYLKPGDPLW